MLQLVFDSAALLLHSLQAACLRSWGAPRQAHASCCTCTVTSAIAQWPKASQLGRTSAYAAARLGFLYIHGHMAVFLKA